MIDNQLRYFLFVWLDFGKGQPLVQPLRVLAILSDFKSLNCDRQIQITIW